MAATEGKQNKFWKNIQNIIPNSEKGQILINLINETSGAIIPDDQTANYINNLFVVKGLRSAASLNKEWIYFFIFSSFLFEKRLHTY